MIFCYPAGKLVTKGINIGICNMLKTGNFRPVGEENDIFRATPFSMALFIIERESWRRYRRYAVRYVRTPLPAVPLCCLCLFRQGPAQHGVHFVILNMQHGTRTREFRQQAHSRRTKQRWHYADNAIRLPATLRHQRKETADGKTAEM
ncbi:Uncharacterised protein [Escherichia coli]|uniref:Uncharacterized protein n=1 Tax=Escherichia coli TaxID=562 RepID=A0A376U6Y9_ECOLX|nr:Uncharacterised protein [Escherichia coli]